MSNIVSLKNKTALVTGASRGIGQAIAFCLAAQNIQVIGTATTHTGADRITTLFQDNHWQGRGLMLDVTSPESINNLFEQIKKEDIKIDILINNAAITQDNLLLRMKDEEWERVITTNLTSIYRLSKYCIRDMMKARWGRIINIGSVVGSMGNPGQVNYSAAKAGVIGFSKALALEVGSRGITVNTVAPGFIETDMTENLTEEQRQLLFQRIPLKRLGHVNDVAAAVLFLVSEGAGYITGETIQVNGGMYMN